MNFLFEIAAIVSMLSLAMALPQETSLQYVSDERLTTMVSHLTMYSTDSYVSKHWTIVQVLRHYLRKITDLFQPFDRALLIESFALVARPGWRRGMREQWLLQWMHPYCEQVWDELGGTASRTLARRSQEAIRTPRQHLRRHEQQPVHHQTQPFDQFSPPLTSASPQAAPSSHEHPNKQDTSAPPTPPTPRHPQS